jgi:hypothetical protein
LESVDQRSDKHEKKNGKDYLVPVYHLAPEHLDEAGRAALAERAWP